MILEEINVHEDTPDDLVHDLFTETLWPGHPLGRPILGTKQSIQAAGRDQVRRFYRKHYVPGNVVVVAAGNLRHEALLDRDPRSHGAGAARSGLGAERVEPARGRRRPRPIGAIRWSAGGRPSRRTSASGRAGSRGPIRTGSPSAWSTRRSDGGMSSRLFQEIREKRGLAYSVYSYHSMYAEAGVFCTYAGTTPGRMRRRCSSIVRDELDDVAAKGLSADEFERAKGHLKGSLVLSLEDPGGRMSRLGKSEIGHGETLTVNQLLQADRVGDAR